MREERKASLRRGGAEEHAARSKGGDWRPRQGAGEETATGRKSERRGVPGLHLGTVGLLCLSAAGGVDGARRRRGALLLS
jgi:hypothetical protein